MRLRVLGAVEVIDSDGLSQEVGGRRVGQIICVLALSAGEIVSDDRLCDALWPDGGERPGNVARTLRTYVTRTRQALAPIAIERLGSGYRLDVEPADLDVTVFEQRVVAGLDAWQRSDAEGAVQELGHALDLWRGEPWTLLDGWDPATIDRHRLEASHATATEFRAAARLALGESDQLIPELLSLVETDPVREFRWEILMRALVASGQQAEALRAYQRAREHLVEELGIEPSPTLRSLERAILDQAELQPLLHDAGAPRRARPTRTAPARPELPALVGRARELSSVDTAVRRVADGSSQIMSISGEAGIGKTRLLQELELAARAAGVDVFWGRCFEAEAGGAFRPIVSVLRDMIRDGIIEPAEVDDATREALAVLLPELGGDGAEDDSLVLDDARQIRLFDGIATVLRKAAAGGLGLLVDDVHWADPATLDLLGHLIRHTADVPVLIGVAFRGNEVDDDHPVHSWVSEGFRRGALIEHRLGGLARDDLGDLVGQADDRRVEHLFDLTAGNPLFALELARVGGSERGGEPAGLDSLPSTVNDLLTRRIASLSDEARKLALVMSLTASRIPVDLLLEASDLETDSTIDRLEELAREGIVDEIVEHGAPGYRFAHDLLRQAALSQLSLTRQAALHHQIALAGERLLAGDHDRWIGRVAHHWFGAGRSADPARAAMANLAAGELAFARTAYKDAEEHYARGLTALGWSPSPDSPTEARLHLRHAEASHRVANVDARRRHAELAVGLALAGGDVETAAWAALVHGGNRSTYGVPNPDTTRLLEQTLTAVRARGSHAELEARLLARLAQEVNHRGEVVAAREMSADAVALVGETGSDATVAAVFRDRVWTLNHPDHFAERSRLIMEMLDRARRSGDAELEMEAAIWGAAASLESGQVSELEGHMTNLELLSERAGVPSLMVRLATLRTTIAMMRGDFGVGMELAEEAHQLGLRVEPENAEQVLHAQMIAPLREQGLLRDSIPLIEGLAAMYDAVPGWRCAVAFVMAEAGEPDRAQAIVDSLSRDGLDTVIRDLAWAQGVSYLAEAVVQLDDASNAQPVYDLLLPFSGSMIALWDIATNGAVDHHLGRLASLLGRHDEAIERLTAAIGQEHRAGQLPMELRSRVSLLHATEARGTPTDGAAAARAAIAEIAAERGFVAIGALVR